MKLQTLKNKAQRLKARLGILFFAFQDQRTPWYAKALIGLVIAYALSLIDLIPDFIPVLGYLDDLILIPGGIALAIKLIPAAVIQESQEKQRNPANTRKYKLYGSIFVLAIWVMLLYLIIRIWQQ